MRAWRNRSGDAIEQSALLVRSQVVQHVEHHDIARRKRSRGNIGPFEHDFAIRCHRAPRASDFFLVEIEASHRQLAAALAQVAREQTDPAADVDHRMRRAAQQFERGRIRGVAAQFPTHVALQPSARIPCGDSLDRVACHRIATFAGS